MSKTHRRPGVYTQDSASGGRRELAREGLERNAFIQDERVIVNVLRERARSYISRC
ncbi:hypothetical protein EMIT0P253_280010 [Pseudomonas sp. IT-P253]